MLVIVQVGDGESPILAHEAPGTTYVIGCMSSAVSVCIKGLLDLC